MKKYLLTALLSLLLVPLLVTRAHSADLTEEEFNRTMDKYLVKYLSDDKNVEKVAGLFVKYQQKVMELRQKQMLDEQKRRLEDQLKNPKKIELGESPILGPANAKITIVEFSDFQCPFCSKGTNTLKEVMKLYPNDVRVAFRHNPLPFHKEAGPASKAAIAAGKQGKFWEMHDLLFQNQQKLGVELYEQLAGQLGLDIGKFRSDMNDPKTQKVIDDDLAYGKSLGVQGTPNFFVGGVQVSGAQPPAQFQMIIDTLLKK